MRGWQLWLLMCLGGGGARVVVMEHFVYIIFLHYHTVQFIIILALMYMYSALMGQYSFVGVYGSLRVE